MFYITFELAKTNKLFNKICFFFCFSFIFVVNVMTYSSDQMELHFIDVGEGDSIFITSKNGENLLIDTGNPMSGYKVASFLQSKHISKIDHLILTHPDIDHIGGIFYIIQMFEIKNIYDNGDDLTDLSISSPFHRFYLDIRSHSNYKVINNQTDFEVKGLKTQILWPPVTFPKKDYNNTSIVLKINFSKFSCLLAGDILQQIEKKLIIQNIDLNVNVLKLGHHGSEHTSSIDFLSKVSPEIAILSVNSSNRNNYPSPSVLKRIEDSKINLYRTDIHGDISILAFPNGKYQISTSK